MIKSALVTGASRGIGRGIGLRLAAHGYRLTVTARDPVRLDETAVTLREAGAPDVQAVAADMADPVAIDAVVDAHAYRYGALNVLILNAGMGTAGSIADMPIRRLDKMLAVNFKAPLAIAQRALPLLRSAAAVDPELGAKVVALSSITGVYSEPGLAAYGATKAALLSLIKTFNVEESGGGVSATAIAPGYVDTDMSEWVHDRIPASSMISVADIVELVDAVLRVSSRSVVSEIVVARAGTDGYRA
jgi:3-oxoacyl-[acyl-carrier protein] reductase